MPLTLQDTLEANNVLTPDTTGKFVQLVQGGAAELEWMNLILALLSTDQFGAFPVSNWEDGSPFKALAQSDAYCLADMSGTVYNAISGGILDLATGPWLDLWGIGLYGEPRHQAVQEVSYLWVTTTGALTLSVGELIVGTSVNTLYSPVTQTGVDDAGNPIFAPSGVDIGPSTTARISVQALSNFPGTAGQTQEGGIQFIVSPSGTGATVTNGDPTGNHAWEIIHGEDQETDLAYRARLKSKWPSLALLRGSTEAAWIFWITQADPNVRQSNVLENVPTGGQVTVYVYPLNPDITNGGFIVDNWINGLNGQKKHRPLCTTVTVLGSITTTIAVTGQLFTKADIGTTTTALNSVLAKYAGIVPMGGSVYLSIVTGLMQNLFGTDHSEGIALQGTPTNVSLSANAIPSFDISGLTITPII